MIKPITYQLPLTNVNARVSNFDIPTNYKGSKGRKILKVTQDNGEFQLGELKGTVYEVQYTFKSDTDFEQRSKDNKKVDLARIAFHQETIPFLEFVERGRPLTLTARLSIDDSSSSGDSQ